MLVSVSSSSFSSTSISDTRCGGINVGLWPLFLSTPPSAIEVMSRVPTVFLKGSYVCELEKTVPKVFSKG